MRATLALSHSSDVAVTTGSPSPTQYEVKENTDGLPGVLAVCQALLSLGKTVTLIADESNATLFNLCCDYTTSVGGLRSKIPVLPLERVREMMNDETTATRPPLFDCVLAVGRVGRNKNGAYLSANGSDISEYLDPVDDIFVEGLSDPRVTTIGIGDSGNQIGMGRVRGAEVQVHTPNGSEIGCVVETDCLVVGGVSNWAGHALSAGLYAVSQCPLHWRYKNHGINAETTPTLDINDFINSERVRFTVIINVCMSNSHQCT